MGPGDYFPKLLVLVRSPIQTFSPSSRLAYGKPKTGSDFSTERGNLPKEVLAYLESKACAKAVRPKRRKS